MERSKNKISVILPVYNGGGREIEACINNLLNQTLHEIEIIIIDDYSTDDTLQIMQEYASGDSRIQIIENSKNLGTFMARKLGVFAANGEYIMFADQDDWYELNAFEELYQKMEEQNVDILMYDAQGVRRKNGKTVIETKVKGLKTEFEEITASPCFAIKNRMTLLWTRIVKADICKKAYENSDNLFLTVGEDTYACWLIHFYAKSFATWQKSFYNWNIKTGISNESTMTLEQYSKFVKCQVDYVSALKDFFSKQQNGKEVRTFFEEHCSDYLGYCITKLHSIQKDERYKAFKLLCEFFDEEVVILKIEEQWDAQEEKLKYHRKMNRQLSKELVKINDSMYIKIERVLATIPRTVNKLLKK